MSKSSAENLLIGAHTSAAGGPHNALLEGVSIGATTIQLFTANQRQWKAKPLTEEMVLLFRETLKSTGLKKIMSHASYLLNLGSPDAAALKKSREAFREEIERCLALGISFVNFHPGASLEGSKEECLDRIVESLLSVEDLFPNADTRLLLETTAGQGSSVGCRFEELAYVLERTHKKVPVGVCIDTCHIFVSGYDVRDQHTWKETLDTFDTVVGLKHLHAFHINDSVKEFGSKRDRHAHLGEGQIGLKCFQFLMTSEKTREIPKYLETPKGPEVWREEIKLLREFAGGFKLT